MSDSGIVSTRTSLAAERTGFALVALIVPHPPGLSHESRTTLRTDPAKHFRRSVLSVFLCVIGCCDQLQIFDSVVGRVAILVVNVLRALQLPSQPPFHHGSMLILGNVSSVTHQYLAGHVAAKFGPPAELYRASSSRLHLCLFPGVSTTEPVPTTGIEPARSNEHGHLRAACLPRFQHVGVWYRGQESNLHVPKDTAV